MKTCSKCKEVKLSHEFGPDTRASDGLQSQCRVCAKAWKIANAEKLRANERARYALNADALRKKKLQEYYANIEKRRATSRKWKEDNPERVVKNRLKWLSDHKEKVEEFRRTYYQQNRSLYLAHAARRRAAKHMATPPWLDAEMRWFISEAYHLAELRKQIVGGNWHVDHIVPLRGKKVCGLHVPWNLQVIPAQVNLRKKNKFVDGQHTLPVF